MTTTFITATTVGAGPLHSFTDDGDELVILHGSGLLSTSGATIAGVDFGDLDVVVQGDLFSPAMQTWNGQNILFSVGQTGTVTSSVIGTSNTFLFFQADGCEIINDGVILASRSVGIITGGGSFVSNFGTIRAQTGVFLGGLGSQADVLVNGGLIHANGIGSTGAFTAFRHAVKVGADGCIITNLADGALVADGTSGAGIALLPDAGGAIIRNYGSIESLSNFGVNLTLVSLGQATSSVFNRGEIVGGAGAFSGSINADVLVNRGVMVGNVLAGAGEDSLDNRRGSLEGAVNLGAGNDVLNNRNGVVSGTIFGDLGNDSLIASDVEGDIFDGGEGVDIVDYRFGPAVQVALDASFENAGGAVNDELFNVEHVYGSRTGADHLRGTSATNLLRGEGGADTLDGATGGDWLVGGRGIDSLIGGAANDTFMFQNLDQIGDVIADFMATAGNDDRFQFSASGFGGGLVIGTLAASRFQSRADNLAQDADDRFIFRTTDQTLWFDVDGSGAALAVMVADLQTGAIVTAADILLA